MLPRISGFLPLLLVSVAHAADAPLEKSALAKIRRAVEAARRKSPVPGLSLAIVKDGRVVLAEGFGWADVAQRKRATADTVFEIGSCTKSFTALLATQAQAEGKLSLQDRPSKYLPGFRLKDPLTNEKITLEDMLSHRSGLPRTDLAWYASDFSRDDLLSLAAEAEPTAPLGKAWQYQNLMFLFSGMIEEKVYGQSYETLLRDRFFRPLGMAHSGSTYAETKAEPLLATGYSGRGNALSLKQADRIAPAGTISSTANDMARYVAMLLVDGQFGGKPVFAKEAIEETRKPRIPMPGGAYGLGWMLGETEGEKRVYHGGNIDGFTALITLIPSQGLGIVALSNGDGASLPQVATDVALDALMPKKADTKAELVPALAEEMGTFRMATPPVEVSFTQEGKTVALNQNGASIPMELVGPKRYTIQKAIYVTFGEKDKDGKRAVRLEQAGMTFTLTAADPYKAPMLGQALLAKVVEAQGGEEAIRRHDRCVIRYRTRLPSDAITEYGIRYRRDAVSTADYLHLYGLGRRFGEMREATDATSTFDWTSFTAPDLKTGPKAADAVNAADLLADLEPWRAYKGLSIVREDKVGGEPVWVLEKTPYSGAKILDFVSQKDFRVLKRKMGSGVRATAQEYSDFRNVDGLILPFKTVTTNAVSGKSVEEIDSIRFDEYVPEWPWRSR